MARSGIRGRRLSGGFFFWEGWKQKTEEKWSCFFPKHLGAEGKNNTKKYEQHRKKNIERGIFFFKCELKRDHFKKEMNHLNQHSQFSGKHSLVFRRCKWCAPSNVTNSFL